MMHVNFSIQRYGENKIKGRLQPTLYNVHMYVHIVQYCISGELAVGIVFYFEGRDTITELFEDKKPKR
jgi:hypothetical protein